MSILIGVNFKDNPKQYIFKCYDAVSIDDLVVVDTRFGFNLATVKSIEPETGDCPMGELKEVVQVVNMGPYNERKEKARKFERLKSAMDEKVKWLQDIAIYELLAEKDPELKSMLEELKTLV